MGRPDPAETDDLCLVYALRCLGNGLYEGEHNNDALSVREIELSTMRRIEAPEEALLRVQQSIAACYGELGRTADGLELERHIYKRMLALNGIDSSTTLISATCLAMSLVDSERWVEAKGLTRKLIPVARRTLGRDHECTLKLDGALSQAICRDDGSSLSELRKAVSITEEGSRRARRVYGDEHPDTKMLLEKLQEARAALARRTPSPP